MTSLTDREREVTELVAEGLSYRGIASRLGLSPRTVEMYVYQIADKIGRTEGVTPLRLVQGWALRRAS